MRIALAHLLLYLAVSAAAQAQSVTLNGQLGNQRALLVINGEPHTVAVGASVRGVKLLSLSAGQAEIGVDGTRRLLVLGAAPVKLSGSGGEAPASGAASIVMTANGDGHFIQPGRINGGNVTFMVDTGATVISIGQADADRLGLKYKDAPTAFANTANGRVPVRSLVLNSVRVGEVEVANVEAIVLPTQMPHVLLGNSFLTRFSMRRDNDTMRLEKRPN
jgi:aspartyl protease family protein